MKEPVYIVEEMGAVVGRVNLRLNKSGFFLNKPFQSVTYMFGHHLEIVTRLQEMSKSASMKGKKFPLIALFTDIPVKIGMPFGFYGSTQLRMIIAHWTEQEYTAPDRLEKSFKQVLQPIKSELIDAISLHSQWTYQGELRYTETERYYWGRTGLYSNEGNMFNDYIDAIEIQDLSLNIHEKVCITL